MDAPFNLITGFKKTTSADGDDHYTGTINLKDLRKAGRGQIQLVLLPSDRLPDGLRSLMKKGEGTSDLLLFAATSGSTK